MTEKKHMVSTATIHRIPLYLSVLKKWHQDGKETVSSVSLSLEVGINASVVKKDLVSVASCEGKPKVGYNVAELIFEIENYLGRNNTTDAIIVGAGKLGRALMGYKGFSDCGLNILAGFDLSDKIISGDGVSKQILPLSELKAFCETNKIKMGILTLPSEAAQSAADALVDAGIRAIWNFTTEHLKIPKTVTVRNENLAASLAILSNQLKKVLSSEE